MSEKVTAGVLSPSRFVAAPDGRAWAAIPFEERFWMRVRAEENGCWSWIGGKTKSGYGTVVVDRRTTLAHRFAYTSLVGDIPTGLNLDHLCRNRACVNPTHLEAVTNHENMLRGENHAARNAKKTHCDHGHLLDEANTYRWRGHRVCRTCRRLAWRMKAARLADRLTGERP